MSTPPPGISVGATISVESIYQLSLATHESVTRIETRQQEDRRQLERMDTRLRSLEQWRLGLAGANLATIVGCAVALVQLAHH